MFYGSVSERAGEKSFEPSHARNLRELIDERLATKQDLRELETRLDSKIEKLEYRLTIRLGGMMAASIAIVAALVKLT